MVNRVVLARVLRRLSLAGYVTLVYAVAMTTAVVSIGPSGPGVIAMAFVAAALSVAGARPVQHQVDRLLRRVLLGTPLTPYHALAAAAGRLRVQSWEQALPGLARAVAEGTSARQASFWLAAGDHLVRAATWPSTAGGFVRTVPDLTALRALPDVDHAVAVLDGTTERGALAIHKAGPAAVSQDNRRLMRDVANTAGLLLRGLTLNAELRERVRLAERLEEELRASRSRLMQVRDIERRRSVTEITGVTGAALAAIRVELSRAGALVTEDPEAAARALARVRPALDELIERFRAVVRGVFPAVLRDEGPRVALEELAADLPRPVLLTGGFGARGEWETESGIYFAAAAVLRALCQRSTADPIRLHLRRNAGRLVVRVDDRAPAVPLPAGLRDGLADQEDRLAALGGGLRLVTTASAVTVLAWLPDRVRPVEVAAPAGGAPPRAGAPTGSATTVPASARRPRAGVAVAASPRHRVTTECAPPRWFPRRVRSGR
ncbi:histidine kinase [Gandjariella thermophila]|uniref:Uncharacterized protein n=1 Tax=Gandjariella thermophila TaxID=1931992 RepID=A0A4D4JAJ5_9PSEU|nr:histidine kinase [Gandjariella thermophila]GDY31698.1 hypothetical protein GTS_33310 [Gandjariella thermophila]